MVDRFLWSSQGECPVRAADFFEQLAAETKAAFEDCPDETSEEAILAGVHTQIALSLRDYRPDAQIGPEGQEHIRVRVQDAVAHSEHRARDIGEIKAILDLLQKVAAAPLPKAAE
ncbi:hypothetical protein HY970_02860 [Candidatus Kaiserbacteria bacterium]|nr:hypothetical protein [Candidatus Kaiserbacteria bacterium]